MMTKGRLLLAATVTIGLGALGIFACTGPEGPAGPPGTAGTSGAQGTPGPQGDGGPEGIPGAAALDGGISSSCLSPCHGFNGIVEQWKTSTHYAVFIANLNGGEVASWTGAGNACGNCHAIDGVERRVAGAVGTLADGGVMNATKGELNYRHPGNGSLQEATYTGSAKVAAVTCVTCHQVTDQNDPHRTGATYTPGSFPLRVASGATDQAMIEKSPDKTAVAGTAAGTFGGANTCVFCHKSRKDVTNYISATTNKLSSPFWGPHEGPQADIFSGIGGYHFSGKTYDGLTATHRAKLTCVDCHMPSVQTNGGTPNHSFYAQLSACTNCHVGAKTFDIDGQRSQVRAALLELQNALNDAGYLTRSESAPYEALTADQLADGAFELDRARPTGGDGGTTPVLTADQAGALYNYFIIARGGALGVHNPKYVRQLIFDSFQAITGNAPTKIVRP